MIFLWLGAMNNSSTNLRAVSMDINQLSLLDCFTINSIVHKDIRGLFAKFSLGRTFDEIGFPQIFDEEFFTVSKKNVIRGMHFQIPPKAGYKSICCMNGRVLDVLLDLRIGSPSYLKSESIELDGDHPKLVCIPPGIAHGFLSLRDDSIMLYKVTEEYSKELDQGIHWDSFSFSWPVEDPICSERDRELPLLSNFINPFIFEKLYHT
jgi:dTDP-4-dehydrorhamnose 3,5-epimerase